MWASACIKRLFRSIPGSVCALCTAATALDGDFPNQQNSLHRGVSEDHRAHRHVTGTEYLQDAMKDKGMVEGKFGMGRLPGFNSFDV